MLQVLASGLALGSIYALVALGFSITWVATKTLNFAQGELVMIGAFLGVTFYDDWGLPYGIALALAVAVVAAGNVVLYHLAVARFARGEAAIGWILSTVAVAIGLRNVAELVWGREARRFSSPVGEKLVDLGPVRLQPQQLLIIAALVVIVIALTAFFSRSIWGKAFSAVAQNRDAAALAGIAPAAIAALAFALSGALAATAGVLLGPVTFVSATMGLTLVIKSFAVAVVAGLDSLRGAVAVGLVFGAAEAAVARYVGTEYRDIFGLLLIMAVLAARPVGLFGKRQVVKV